MDKRIRFYLGYSPAGEHRQRPPCIKFGGRGAIAAERIEDLDKDIYFLEEKIAEMRERSDIMKTLTARPAASRISFVGTMQYFLEEGRTVFTQCSNDGYTI